MKSVLTDEEKDKKIAHFRRLLKYRSWFGYVFTIVGFGLFVVGFDQGNFGMIMINGILFSGYGIFMIWQAKRALRNLSSSSSS